MRKKIIALTLALLCLAVNAFAAPSSEPINDAEGNQIGVRLLDENGRVDTEKYGVENPADPVRSDAAKTVYYFYDGRGNLLVTQTTEKVNDQKSVTRTADGNGNVFSTTESTVDPATGTATSLEYDQNGNLVGKTTYEMKDDRSEIIKTYDAQGNLTGTTEMNEDPATGDLSWYNYDRNGALESVTYSSDKGGSVSLDPDGKLLYASTSDGNLYYSADTGKWMDMNGNEVSAPDVSSLIEKVKELLKKRQKAKQPEAIWYTNNTACVPGIRLRDEYPDLTDKWYNVLPVDLSHDGTQTFDLVASNMYYLGKVYVTVAGDDVTVDYSYLKHVTYQIKPQQELVTWFTGLEQITTEFLENPTSEMKFGQAISKEKDLNGQDTALLFVCNRVTYRTPLNTDGAMPIRYWPNSSKLADYFANVHTLLERNEAEYAEKKAAAEGAEAEAAPASNP